jgi:hypothetical protein
VKTKTETAAEAPCLFPEERKNQSKDLNLYKTIEIAAPDLIREWGSSIG